MTSRRLPSTMAGGKDLGPRGSSLHCAWLRVIIQRRSEPRPRSGGAFGVKNFLPSKWSLSMGSGWMLRFRDGDKNVLPVADPYVAHRALRYEPAMMSVMAVSLLRENTTVSRPQGIRILSGFCFILAAYLLTCGVLISLGTISMASGRYVLGDSVTMGPVLFFAVATASVLVAVGLYQGWRVMRRIAIILFALFLATSLLPISAAVTYWQLAPLAIHGVKVVAGIMAIRYLMQLEVVDFFSTKNA